MTAKIRLGNPNSPMGQRIKAAKKKAEAELAEKVQKSRDPSLDVRNLFSDEELEQLLARNELFEGHMADWTALQRYAKLAAAARWLDANSTEVVRVEIEDCSPSRPNAVVVMDIRRLASLQGRELKVYAGIVALADDLFLAGNKDEIVRFTFGIRDIWQE